MLTLNRQYFVVCLIVVRSRRVPTVLTYAGKQPSPVALENVGKATVTFQQLGDAHAGPCDPTRL